MYHMIWVCSMTAAESNNKSSDKLCTAKCNVVNRDNIYCKELCYSNNQRKK